MSEGPPLQPDQTRFEPSSNTQRAAQYSHLTQQPELRPSPAPPEAAALPGAYGLPLFELLVVDPLNVFVSWEITPGQQAAAMEYLGVEAYRQRRLLAQFYGAGQTDTPMFSTELFGDVGRWFIACDAAGDRLRAVLAYEAGGRHFPLASSGTVSMPRLRPVEPYDYKELSVNYERLADGRLSLGRAMLRRGEVPAGLGTAGPGLGAWDAPDWALPPGSSAGNAGLAGGSAGLAGSAPGWWLAPPTSYGGGSGRQ
jgi:hypothetical protein